MADTTDATLLLREPPAALAETRQSLHRLAAYVIAPTRYRATGRFGLRWAPGGFTTPLFPDGPVESVERRIRVEGATLVDERGGEARTTPITTLRAAAEWLGAEIDPSTAAESDSTPLGDPDAPLGVDEAAARFLGAWYGLAFTALEALRADPAAVNPSEAQLWPGHFDAAIEAGDDDHRASYGASPGDGPDGTPYLYVSVWWPDRLGLARPDGGPAAGTGGADNDFWNAATFTGRRLTLVDIPAGTDPTDAARRFLLESRARLDALPAKRG